MYSLSGKSKVNPIEIRVRKMKKKYLADRKLKEKGTAEYRYLTHKIGVLNEVLGL